jgi:hypothetical protein
MTSDDTEFFLRKSGARANSAADAVTSFLGLPKLDPLVVLLLTEVRIALVEAANAIGDVLTPDAPPVVPSRTVPGRKGAVADVLRACLCTHPFSDHDDENTGGGPCAMCTCEVFEANEVVRPKLKHRHKFDGAGRCTVCGKQKSANGRKPAAPPAPTAEERTLPLPAARLVGDAAADRFVDGGQGSSGVRR